MVTRPRLFMMALVALLVAASSCGGAQSPADSTSPAHEEKAAKEKTTGSENKKATCTHGKVFLGKESGVIRFAVRCTAPARGARVGFSLARYSLTTQRSKPRIRHFDHHPTVLGPGTTTKVADCRSVATVVDCQVSARGRITISGEFRVKRTTECEMGVSIVVAEPPKCTGQVCPASLAVKTLTRGLPRDC